MSENITHTAIVDDSVRLITADPEQPPILGAVLAHHHDLARLGGITRAGDKCNPRLLDQIREGLRAGSLDAAGNEGAKLAFVLGWLSHRAADRTVKKILRDLDGDCQLSPKDCSIYHDACVLREVYGLGGAPYDPDLLQSEAGGATAGLGADRFAELDRLVRVSLQRNLIAIHTLIPDTRDPDAWLDRLLASFQRHRVDLRRYAQAVTAPDPDLWRRFITEPPFWSDTDPWIARARALQAEPTSSWTGEPGEPTAIYGRALRRAVGYLRSAGAFLQGALDEADLLERLEIGRPELAG